MKEYEKTGVCFLCGKVKHVKIALGEGDEEIEPGLFGVLFYLCEECDKKNDEAEKAVQEKLKETFGDKK